MIQPRALSRPQATLAALLVIGILLRVLVSANLLNLSYAYSGETGGALLLKIHPGTYLLFATACFAATLPRQANGAALERAAIVLTGGVAAVLITAGLLGRVVGIGYLVDAVLVSAAVLFSMSRLGEEGRLTTARLLLFGLLVNAAVVLFEAATRSHLIPYPYRELVFRPAGLVGHPLLTGVLTVSALPAVPLLFRRDTVRGAIVLALLIAVVVSGARAAAAIAVATTAVMLVAGGYRALRDATLTPARALLYGAVPVGLVLLGLQILPSTALGQRLAGSWFRDQSVLARIDVYAVLGRLSPRELWTGIDPLYAERLLEHQGLDHIESPIVAAVLAFGLAGAGLLGLTLLAFAILMARRSAPAALCTVAFLVLASSNNTLTTKTPALAAFAVFVVALAAAKNRYGLGASRTYGKH